MFVSRSFFLSLCERQLRGRGRDPASAGKLSKRLPQALLDQAETMCRGLPPALHTAGRDPTCRSLPACAGMGAEAGPDLEPGHSHWKCRCPQGLLSPNPMPALILSPCEVRIRNIYTFMTMEGEESRAKSEDGFIGSKEESTSSGRV